MLALGQRMPVSVSNACHCIRQAVAIMSVQPRQGPYPIRFTVQQAMQGRGMGNLMLFKTILEAGNIDIQALIGNDLRPSFMGYSAG